MNIYETKANEKEMDEKESQEIHRTGGGGGRNNELDVATRSRSTFAAPSELYHNHSII